jgi:hypothetical protein
MQQEGLKQNILLSYRKGSQLQRCMIGNIVVLKAIKLLKLSSFQRIKSEQAVVLRTAERCAYLFYSQNKWHQYFQKRSDFRSQSVLILFLLATIKGRYHCSSIETDHKGRYQYVPLNSCTRSVNKRRVVYSKFSFSHQLRSQKSKTLDLQQSFSLTQSILEPSF